MTDGTDRESTVQRRSLGGHVVEAGLAAVGFDASANNDVALVETARPHRSPYRIVLAQNAWNVVDISTFWTLLGNYPMSRRLRYIVRRVIAGINLRRAKKVVCLTESMSALCAKYSSNVVTSPVTVPVDFLSRSAPQAEADWSDTVLVPGTVTWHKNPVEAIRIVQALQRNGTSIAKVVFAGSDDGSGSWQEVESAANAAGIPCSRMRLSRDEMSIACASAAAVVIPSHLESLSLSMAEALATASIVIASDIPAHRELARRLGREPVWGRDEVGLERLQEQALPDLDVNGLWREWNRLGESLDLPTMAGPPEG